MSKISFIKFIFLVLLLSQTLASYARADNNPNIDNEIQSLVPYIGSFPPNFKSEKEKNEITTRYTQVKKQLDALIAKNPNDLQLIFKRGYLQRLGHNMDVPEAWKGSETDLLQVIKLDPKNKAATVELASLYVNTDPSLAMKAEALFKKAEALGGQDYKEDIERGLYFAYYYQGKLCEAQAQAKLLVKNWPQSNYQPLLNTVDTVLLRSGKKCKE